MKSTQFYTYLGLTLALLALGFILIKPYLTALVFAVVLAYILHPWHEKLAKKLTPHWSAVLFTAAALAVIVVVVQYGLMTIIFELVKVPDIIDQISTNMSSSAATSIENAIRKIIGSLVTELYNVVYKIPQTLISFFVFLFTLYYALKDGKSGFEWFKSIIPLDSDKRDDIFKEARSYVRAFVRVQLLIGLLQGIVAGIGFKIFGLPYALPAAIFAGVLSITPLIGPYLLYVPTGLIVGLTGNMTAAFGIVLYGVIIGSFLDYLIRPNLTSKYAKIHPLVVFLGLLGGVASMGAVGIVAGPIILSVLIVVIKQLDIPNLLQKTR